MDRLSQQCTARSKQSGTQCRRQAMVGSTKCYMHGGATPKGIASPNLKHGKYSKYMPERLLERYQAALQDNELLELNHEIALIDSRLSDLLTRVDTGEAGKLWTDARKLNLELQQAVHDENYGRLMIKATELDFVIGTGLTDHAAWSELSTLIEQRRKLVESQRKRLIEGQQMITTEQAMLFVTAVLDTVRRNVKDKEALYAIGTDIARLTASAQTTAK